MQKTLGRPFCSLDPKLLLHPLLTTLGTLEVWGPVTGTRGRLTKLISEFLALRASPELSGLPNANAKSQRFSNATSQIAPLPPVVALNRSFKCHEDVNGAKLTVKKWWIFGAAFFTVYAELFMAYKGHKR